MITPTEFRTGQYSIPLHTPDELPECCGHCRYLIYEEFTVCFIDAPFYYHCAYSQADQPADYLPPCLAATGAA